MTIYAILHKNDPERCIRFFRQYCKDWHENYDVGIRNFFNYTSPSILREYLYSRIDSDYARPQICRELEKDDKFIDFENNPRRRAI